MTAPAPQTEPPGGPRRADLRPLSAGLIALGVALPAASTEGLSWVLALALLLVLPPLLGAAVPARATLAAALPPALIGVLVGTLRWEGTLVVGDTVPHIDPHEIGDWAFDQLAAGERGVGGLLVGGALGVQRLLGRPARAAAIGLGLAGALAWASGSLAALAFAAFADQQTHAGDLFLIAMGPVPPMCIATVLGLMALRTRAAVSAGAAVGLLAVAMGGLVPAPRLLVALSTIDAARPDLPTGAPGPALAGPALPHDSVDFDAILASHGRAPNRDPRWACRRFDRRWVHGARAAELVAAPGDAPVALLRPAAAALRRWSVDRMGLAGRATEPPSLLDPLSGAAALWSRPAARLLLDAPPAGAAWVQLGPDGLVGAPPPRTDDSPRLDCVLDTVDTVTVQTLYTTVRGLTEGPSAPCRAVAWAPLGASPADLCASAAASTPAADR